ncbi:enoyl-CoA hydratase-related protein [Dietzia sp.]|uniref:enoyl-CoA hydratase-related protein n=1 Tax=Dietzia sp. TaxID=1871616 RepID=UPI002FDA70C3
MVSDAGQRTFDTLEVDIDRSARTAVVTLNRPEKLNALNVQVQREMAEAVEELDADPGIGAIVVTGSEKAFAAGADISEMSAFDYPRTFVEDFMGNWARVSGARTPLIAAVSGYALGGGCELAMMCDIILAAENAKFGQPEINLGVIPGMGGSQRLTRAIGQYKAMDLILTGRMMGAEEAERAGLVSRIVPTAELLEEAKKTAATIASKSDYSTKVAKLVTRRALETTLEQGLEFEKANFYAMFGTPDQNEGMAAFVDKREPKWDR